MKLNYFDRHNTDEKYFDIILTFRKGTQKEKIIQDPNHMLRFCLPEYKGSKIIFQIIRGGKDVIQPEDNGESSQERGVGHGGHVGTLNQGHS